MRVSAEAVRTLIIDVLAAWGMDHDLAETTAEVMAETDLAGIDSHGVSMLMTYEQFRAEGRIDLRARPTVERENAASALVDAHGGIGHPAGEFAMRMAIDKARVGTVAVVLGGTSLFGGRGSVLGTLMGALIVAVLRSGLTQLGVDALYQDVATGALVIAAVVFDRLARRQR